MFCTAATYFRSVTLVIHSWPNQWLSSLSMRACRLSRARDFIVSSEFQTASAVARLIGVPGARQADFFLDGEVQVLQFDVSGRAPPAFCGRPLAKAGLPRQSRVVGIVRDGEQLAPGPRERLLAGIA